jgi:hypothetical protein
VEETGTRDRPLLSAALERIPPQLEAPPEMRESPQAVEEVPERAEPQPDPLRVGVRIAPSFRYYGNYKHFSALGSIRNRAYLYIGVTSSSDGGAERGAWRGDCKGIGAGYSGSWI